MEPDARFDRSRSVPDELEKSFIAKVAWMGSFGNDLRIRDRTQFAVGTVFVACARWNAALKTTS
jgi:hypothetical protein